MEVRVPIALFVQLHSHHTKSVFPIIGLLSKHASFTLRWNFCMLFGQQLITFLVRQAGGASVQQPFNNIQRH